MVTVAGHTGGQRGNKKQEGRNDQVGDFYKREKLITRMINVATFPLSKGVAGKKKKIYNERSG